MSCFKPPLAPAFAASALSALVLAALPAVAQDSVISPVLTEEAAEAVGQTVESVPAGGPFLLIDRDRFSDDTTSSRDWLLNSGIDRPGDLDPRDSLLIPQPEPNLILRLR